MLILVSGGSASGKSAFAESLIVQSGLASRVYLATMQVRDKESEARVERHRAMRADKGFTTVELPFADSPLTLPPASAVLLEDLPNLAANEFFGPAGAEGRILAALDRLICAAELLVVVTGEVYSDGVAYDGETAAYLALLAALSRALARRAGAVYEVVCGIPVRHKP